MKSGCPLPVQDDCSQTDTASRHPDFLTVFWDLTCHPCQQSAGDLLANGATVSHGPLGATGQSPLLFMIPLPCPTPFQVVLTLLPLYFFWGFHISTSQPFPQLFLILFGFVNQSGI